MDCSTPGLPVHYQLPEWWCYSNRTSGRKTLPGSGRQPSSLLGFLSLCPQRLVQPWTLIRIEDPQTSRESTKILPRSVALHEGETCLFISFWTWHTKGRSHWETPVPALKAACPLGLHSGKAVHHAAASVLPGPQGSLAPLEADPEGWASSLRSSLSYLPPARWGCTEGGSPGSWLGVSYRGLHLPRSVAWGKLLHLSEPPSFTASLSGIIQGMSWILPDLW